MRVRIKVARQILSNLNELEQYENVVLYIRGDDVSNGRACCADSQDIDTIISMCKAFGLFMSVQYIDDLMLMWLVLTV